MNIQRTYNRWNPLKFGLKTNPFDYYGRPAIEGCGCWMTVSELRKRQFFRQDFAGTIFANADGDPVRRTADIWCQHRTIPPGFRLFYAPSDPQRPILRFDGFEWYLEFDGIDDYLEIPFPAPFMEKIVFGGPPVTPITIAFSVMPYSPITPIMSVLTEGTPVFNFYTTGTFFTGDGVIESSTFFSQLTTNPTPTNVRYTYIFQNYHGYKTENAIQLTPTEYSIYIPPYCYGDTTKLGGSPLMGIKFHGRFYGMAIYDKELDEAGRKLLAQFMNRKWL